MKKLTVGLAAALMIAGLALIAATVLLIDFDFTRLDTASYTETDYPIVGGFTAIEKIQVDTADVRLVPTTDGTFRVVCYDKEGISYSVVATDGVLTVTTTDARTWKDYVGFHFEKSAVTVYMPQGVYGSLVIEGSTGDVEIPADFSFTRMDVAISTGDITCRASVAKGMKLATSTGNIDINGVTVGSLSLSTSTGDIACTDVTCADAASISVSTGDVKLERMTCGSLSGTGNTGEIALCNVLVDGQLKITRSTGGVALFEVDAASLDVVTDTGDVTGVLLSTKVFDTDTSTGDVRVPVSGEGGICKIRTDTGDINIRVSTAQTQSE